MFAARAAFMSGKSKAPSGSAYFDGTGDLLGIAGVTTPGNGQFTVEFWWRPVSLSSYQTPFDKGYVGSGALLFQTGLGDGKINVYGSGSVLLTSSTAVTVNSWTHVALSRTSNGVITLYQNGNSVGTYSSAFNFSSTTSLGIGGSIVNSIPYPINGYISNFRFVTGTSVYTTSFTPPTTPLTAISGTQLLTCQSATTITDASANAFTVDKVGDAAPNALNPF